MVDWTITTSDVAIVFATLMGPVLAVQAQKCLERRRDDRSRREAIFRELMATRATTLAPRHVEALNAISIEFYGVGPKIRAINDMWRSYIDHLNRKDLENQIWTLRREELYIDLLYAMAVYLGYKFNKTQLAREVYYPEGHLTVEMEHHAIRRGLARMLTDGVVPMAVESFPIDPNLRDADLELRALLKRWLESQLVAKPPTPGPG